MVNTSKKKMIPFFYIFFDSKTCLYRLYFETGPEKGNFIAGFCKLAYADIECQDQDAHPRCLIRAFRTRI